jgi:hypothetical protein
LQAEADPYAEIVTAALREKMALRARRMALQENAPIEVQTAAQNAMNAWNAALQPVAPLATSDDPIVSAHAAAMLGENAINAQKYEDAVKWLTIASGKEAQDLNLRVALATAHFAVGDKATALATRDTVLRALPPTFEALRQTALLTRRMEEKQDALRLMRQALNVARVSPEVSAYDAKTTAFLTARAFFTATEVARGLEIYNQLAGPTRPKWEQAAALLDAEAHLRAAGSTREADKLVERLRALGLKREEFQAPAAYLENLE